MPSAGPNASARFGADIAEVLARVDTPEIRKFMLRSENGFFSGGRQIQTQGFAGGQLVMKWQLASPLNFAALGATSGTTAVPDGTSGYRFENVAYKRGHFNDILTTFTLDEAAKDYINSAPTYQAGLENLATKLLTDNLEGFELGSNILMVADRRAILGTITRTTNAAGTVLSSGVTNPDDNTIESGFDPVSGTVYTGKYTFIIELGVDCIPAAFRPNMQLSVCALPSNYGGSSETGAAVGNVRNYGLADASSNAVHTPVVVDGMPIFDTYDSNGTVMKIPCAVYYTDSTHKAAVLVAIHTMGVSGASGSTGTVGTGDVVTLYAGNLAATGTTKTQGPNFGCQGLLHWLTRANIQTAGGAVGTTTYLYDTENNQVSRASTGNASFWYPYMKLPTTYNTTQITMAVVDSVARQMAFQNGPDLGGLIPVANSLIVNQLCEEVGNGKYRQSLPTWDARGKERYQTYGFRGVSLQSSTFAPTDIGVSEWLPPMGVIFIDPSDFWLLSPKAGEWKDLGSGSIFHPLHNGDGKLKLGSQAVYMRGIQVHAQTLWNQGAAWHYRP